MSSKSNLLQADGYQNLGIGLHHGDPTISVRMPLAKKKEFEVLADRLIELGRTKNKQDFLRGLIYADIENNLDLIQGQPDQVADVAIEPEPTPETATPKKSRVRKTKTKENGANL